jgi:hypothetical protein
MLQSGGLAARPEGSTSERVICGGKAILAHPASEARIESVIAMRKKCGTQNQ